MENLNKPAPIPALNEFRDHGEIIDIRVVDAKGRERVVGFDGTTFTVTMVDYYNIVKSKALSTKMFGDLETRIREFWNNRK